MYPIQLSFLQEKPVITELAPDVGIDHGEVFTRRWVVDLILDLVGYEASCDLATQTIVEPSCGTGAFLVPIVERLIESCRRHGRELETAASSIRAFDLLNANSERARKAVVMCLEQAGLDQGEAEELARTWIATGDFLLSERVADGADYVVGNPPYIRLESMSRSTMEAYRRLYPTMRGRSDVYVGFIERGLAELKPGGALSYICADRWMRNQYGARLRELIAGGYGIETVITMHDADAFEDEVSAYPAVVVLRNGPQRKVSVIAADRSFGHNDVDQVSSWVRQSNRRSMSTPSLRATKLDGWFEGGDLWPTGTPAQLALVADLEAKFPPLEDVRTKTRVGIGVATGCDDVYITTDSSLVEEERLLPLLRAADTTNGVAEWSGGYLVNPWCQAGLVELRRFPRLQDYLEANSDVLRARHVARRQSARWYRTIDRVDLGLLGRSKLVLPDLKAFAHPVLDEGNYYPHHNLYFVVSDNWDLEVLGGLLLSDIANLFVGAYCVKMRGGCYRFQAQYLRRIRVPNWESISTGDRRALASAFSARDVEAATAAALRLYGLQGLP